MQEAMGQTFSAPMGKTTVQMTVVATIVLLFAGGLQLLFGLQRDGAVRRLLISIGVITLACVPASLLLKVRHYQVTSSQLVVKYGLSTRSFPLAEVQNVQIDSNLLRRSRRDAANGGLWSFLGSFSNAQRGRIRAYVSDLDKAVVLQMPEYLVIVSPDDPDAFVRAVKSQKGAG